MAQFDFAGTWVDSWAHLERLVDTGRFSFVVDKWYTEPVPLQFRALDEDIRDIVRHRRGVYLFSDSYSRFPVAFGPPTSNGLMLIAPKEGGPSLELVLPACFEKEGKTHLRSGWLMHQPYFQNPETGEWYRAPEELRLAYKQVCALLRRGLVKRYMRIYPVKASPPRCVIQTKWIGPDGAALLEAGAAELNGRSGQEFAKTRTELEALPDEPE